MISSLKDVFMLTALREEFKHTLDQHGTQLEENEYIKSFIYQDMNSPLRSVQELIQYLVQYSNENQNNIQILNIQNQNLESQLQELKIQNQSKDYLKLKNHVEKLQEKIQEIENSFTPSKANTIQLLDEIQTKELELLRVKDQTMQKQIKKAKLINRELKEQIKQKDLIQDKLKNQYESQIEVLSKNLQLTQIQASDNLQLGKQAYGAVFQETESRYSKTINELNQKVLSIQDSQYQINTKLQERIVELEKENKKLIERTKLASDSQKTLDLSMRNSLGKEFQLPIDQVQYELIDESYLQPAIINSPSIMSDRKKSRLSNTGISSFNLPLQMDERIKLLENIRRSQQDNGEMIFQKTMKMQTSNSANLDYPIKQQMNRTQILQSAISNNSKCSEDSSSANYKCQIDLTNLISDGCKKQPNQEAIKALNPTKKPQNQVLIQNGPNIASQIINIKFKENVDPKSNQRQDQSKTALFKTNQEYYNKQSQKNFNSQNSHENQKYDNLLKSFQDENKKCENRIKEIQVKMKCTTHTGGNASSKSLIDQKFNPNLNNTQKYLSSNYHTSQLQYPQQSQVAQQPETHVLSPKKQSMINIDKIMCQAQKNREIRQYMNEKISMIKNQKAGSANNSKKQQLNQTNINQKESKSQDRQNNVNQINPKTQLKNASIIMSHAQNIARHMRNNSVI
ncbi:UNKNOWN [Stylonychia lemnae]|uniref:Uncharacterized protein n=1 Tax=Stylonychia lemnae TaxID=5949 RepID=A0A078B7I3_STYLE|nr:UNKNOWN [Stylonychia lemnae]|eukprot:CDW90369.1 UNKNOWN [Stylonychia lemnae]